MAHDLAQMLRRPVGHTQAQAHRAARGQRPHDVGEPHRPPVQSPGDGLGTSPALGAGAEP